MVEPLTAPPGVPFRGHESEMSRLARLSWIRDRTGRELRSLQQFDLDASRLVGNIENVVGSVSIPVGLVGPLLFNGIGASGWITAPFATTEGALVASATRGARTLSRAGGVSTRVLSQRMVRAPHFDFEDIAQAHEFASWVVQQRQALAEQIATVSNHARLIGLRPVQIGRSVDLMFEYETGDAAGQNMTTACTWQGCLWIEKQLVTHPRIVMRTFCIEGNTAGDKKLSHGSMISGRGTRVTAECYIDGRTINEVLKVGRDDLLKAYNINVVGTALGGGTSPNINVANTIAAIFAATGQDLACIHESGAGILNLEPDGDGVYASLLLPALAIGTVGGGTGLPQQADYLDMLGCSGSGKVQRLAEVIAGFALALDLSTLSAVIGGQFATAHERLGRNRPVQWFTARDLTVDFFRDNLIEPVGRAPSGPFDSVEVAAAVSSFSVISELTQRVSSQKLVGVVPVDLHPTDGGRPLELVVKSKPLDREVVLAAHRLVSLAGGRLVESWSRGSDASGFLGTHMRELELYRNPGPLAAIMPACYGVVEAPEREMYLLLLERLDDTVILRDSADRPMDWSDSHVRAAIDGISLAHGHWYGRTDELETQEWMGPATDAGRVAEMSDLWRGLFEHHRREHPELVPAAWYADTLESVDTISTWWPELQSMPTTLVHNDFNPRNIALRTSPTGGPHTLVAYDWELATIGVPQRDLVELLAYVLQPDVPSSVVTDYVEHHRRAVARLSGSDVDAVSWRRGYRLALADFVLRRLSLYLLVYAVYRLPFLERVMATVRRLDEIERDHVSDTR